ncbi:hypothetical protein LXT21_18275 [Myxococcus sp. K38C18041901]|uniref:hypothetical protein n=1 Tax=Myxococcus guangdongensis TaxID=2906760 RepID=UPI0020A6F67D|nr:hypothetical protein [Myxococcus guangdongensis]MCP3060735.1 hypothetical protein [Myxococcus guangdongensis]
MAGPLTTLLLSGVLAAGPGGFTFEGREASAGTERPDGFFIQGPLPFTDLAESGTGSAELTVEDRVDLAQATYGDKASFQASFRLGNTEYRVELAQAGFPPAQARSQASAALPPPPRHTVGGGVLLNVPIYGDSGLGWSAMTRSHAAVAVWGVGSVWRDGRLLTDTALIHVAALDAGAFADDSTHRMLRQARAGDTELVVLAYNLPTDVERRGFVQFVFEDVAIEVAGVPVRSVAVVENTGGLTVDPSRLTPVPANVAPGLPPILPQPTATGGSGLATGTAGVTTTPESPEVISGTFPTTVVADPPVNSSGATLGTPTTSPTLASEGVLTTGAAPAGTAPGFFGSSGTTSSLATTGSFSVPVPSVSAPNFDAFLGTSQVSPGILSTAPPLNAAPGSPPSGLLGTPTPLNATPAPPLFGTPTPLNAGAATSLPAAPAPANAAPATTAPAGSAAPAN